MPTARICLRQVRWYYLFIFYSLMSCTDTFYLMETTTTSNLFATYGVTKKKDYKAELLRELAEDEDLFIATSTIHFLKRVKTMRYKYVTDVDVDETTTPQTDLSDTTGSSKIQNKSISLKNKTFKRLDSLWNLMKTISDDSGSNSKLKDHRFPTTDPEMYSSLKNIDSFKCELYDEDVYFQLTEKTKKSKKLTKATTTQSKFKGSKRNGKKKKINPSNHKKRKGHKSNFTEGNSNIVNISVRRALSTPACKCKSSKFETKDIVKKKPMCCNNCRNKWKKLRLARRMKPIGKKQQQCYKVNNTILLNVHNNGHCGCGKRKKVKCFVEHTIGTTTQLTSTTTTQLPTITTTQLSTTTTTKTTTTTLPKTTTSTPTTTKKETTTEIDDCPDVFTCPNEGMTIPMPCCLCSYNLRKKVGKVQKKIKYNKCTSKRKKSNKTGLEPTEYDFKTMMILNEKSSRRFKDFTRPKSTVFVHSDLFKKTRRVPKRPKKNITLESVKKIITSLPTSTFKHSLTSNLFSPKKKRCSFSTSTNRNHNCNRRKCSTSKPKNKTTTCFHVRPSLTEESDAYDDEMKETEYYEDYYDEYDESATANNTSTNEPPDDQHQKAQALPHHDIDGSTMFPEDDPAMSAYNLLNHFPFNYGKCSTADSDYEENFECKHTSDLNPNILESIGQRIYITALKLKRDLDETRSARSFMEKKSMLVRHNMENLYKIQKRCNYLLREINFSRKGYIRKLQQLLGLSKVREQVEKRIKGKLRQILDGLKRRNSK